VEVKATTGPQRIQNVQAMVADSCLDVSVILELTQIPELQKIILNFVQLFRVPVLKIFYFEQIMTLHNASPCGSIHLQNFDKGYDQQVPKYMCGAKDIFHASLRRLSRRRKILLTRHNPFTPRAPTPNIPFLLPTQIPYRTTPLILKLLHPLTQQHKFLRLPLHHASDPLNLLYFKPTTFPSSTQRLSLFFKLIQRVNIKIDFLLYDFGS
jgi:hypothetical protein